MFNQKYELKKSVVDRSKWLIDDYTCLRCGKKEIRQRPPFLPLPNPSLSGGNASRLDCIMKIHTFVPSVNAQERK